MTTLGAALRWYRFERGLSQLRLGRLAGVSYTTIGKIEHGKCQPSPDVLRAIADGLDVQLGALWRMRRDGAA